MAKTEGVFAEPGSAASLAGVIKMRQLGKLASGKKVVCVLTGNGLKDPQTAMEQSQIKPQVIPCELSALVRAVIA